MHLHRLHRQQQSLINPAARYRFSLGRTYYIFIQVCKCDAMKEIEAGSWGQKAVFVKILALSHYFAMRRFPFVQAANSLSVSNVFSLSGPHLQADEEWQLPSFPALQCLPGPPAGQKKVRLNLQSLSATCNESESFLCIFVFSIAQFFSQTIQP